jgi:hypothetical protein
MTQGESQRVWQAGMALCSAEAHVRAAHEQHRAWDWPYWTARTDLNWAVLLEGRPGRRSEAELLARSSVGAGEHLGNDWLVERAQLVLDAAASDQRGAAEGGV